MRSITLPIAPPRISASALQNRRWPAFFFQQVDDEEGRGDADAGEEIALPAGALCQEAEGSAFVINQYQIEKRGHRSRFPIGEQARDGDLGQLVEQDHDRRDAKPWCQAGSGGIRIGFSGHVVVFHVSGWSIRRRAGAVWSGKVPVFAGTEQVRYAAAAQARMPGVAADVGPIVPAALALLVRGRRDDDRFLLGLRDWRQRGS